MEAGMLYCKKFIILNGEKILEKKYTKWLIVIK